MTRQVTLTLPDEVYNQIEQMAAADRRAIDAVLVETIVQATPALYVDPRRAAMLREKAAFLAQHSELLEQYEGEYVAILHGHVVDHDPDVLALVRRINRDYRDEVVLIKQVTDRPDRVLEFRSPSFVRIL